MKDKTNKKHSQGLRRAAQIAAMLAALVFRYKTKQKRCEGLYRLHIVLNRQSARAISDYIHESGSHAGWGTVEHPENTNTIEQEDSLVFYLFPMQEQQAAELEKQLYERWPQLTVTLRRENHATAAFEKNR